MTISQDLAAASSDGADWTPRAKPPLGIELDDRQQLAAAFRILAAEGCSEHMSGHITVAMPAGRLRVNPWGLWWDEITASDLCVVDAEGMVIEGRWDVTPAIHIHTELHRRRADALVVVHNHPYHVTVLAALGLLPEVLHQTGCLFDGETRFVDEYTGEIDSASLGANLADRIGEASVIVLANHGVIVTAPTVEEAVYKTAAFERQCRLAYDVLIGTTADRVPTTIPPAVRPAMKKALLDRVSEVYFAGWVRRLLRTQPETFA
jgi:ribulose-5-phosphate 4-epimerase/fuculose-1-phosphate aldolase